MEHHRALIRVSGADKATLLQGIITQDIGLLATQPIIFTAMLSPQGKWQHDFFIFTHDGDFYIDHDATTTETLFKRLKLYKLRADVALEIAEGWHFAFWHTHSKHPEQALYFHDPRHTELPARVWATTPIASDVDADDYLATRVAFGIPEGGHDITEKETALDAGYDLLNGVSFTKGCYVGQEVTARMHYKSVARKGFFQVASETNLPQDITTINCNGKPIAELRSHKDNEGLAYGRLDIVLAAMDAEDPCEMDGQLVTLCPPLWQAHKIDQYHINEQEKAGSANA